MLKPVSLALDVSNNWRLADSWLELLKLVIQTCI